MLPLPHCSTFQIISEQPVPDPRSCQRILQRPHSEGVSHLHHGKVSICVRQGIGRPIPIPAELNRAKTSAMLKKKEQISRTRLYGKCSPAHAILKGCHGFKVVCIVAHSLVEAIGHSDIFVPLAFHQTKLDVQDYRAQELTKLPWRVHDSYSKKFIYVYTLILHSILVLERSNPHTAEILSSASEGMMTITARGGSATCLQEAAPPPV